MTFLYMAKQERNILNEEHFIQDMCPSDLGYEPKEKCKAIIGLEIKEKYYTCRRCWEREMPNTEESEYAKGVKAGLDSIECEVKKSYEKGMNDVWEFIFNKTGNMTPSEFSEIFDCMWTRMGDEYTPQEAFAKLKAYEDSKIEVGDVVEVNGRAIVVNAIRLDCVLGLDRLGEFYEAEIGKCKKTGKHIDIQQILDSIGD